MITQRLGVGDPGDFSASAEVHEDNFFSFDAHVTIKQSAEPSEQTIEWMKRTWAMLIEIVDTEIERQEALVFKSDETEDAK